MSNKSIPNVNEIMNQGSAQMTQEERAACELLRCSYINRCRNYLTNYIRKKAPGKIKYRAKVLGRSNAYIFRFSAPTPRGVKTRYFSQIWLNVEKDEVGFDYTRPVNHPKEVWYFPIYYMINGFTKNPRRTFQAIGIDPVFNCLRAMFEPNYTIKLLTNQTINGQQSGLRILVEWPQLEQKSEVKPEEEQEEEPEQEEKQEEEPEQEEKQE